MTLQERADAYARAFAKWPASHLRVVHECGGDVLYGTWCLGQNYRAKAGYYGEHPPGYLPRVSALFPDVTEDTLHVFSGSLPAGHYMRLDVNPANGAELVGDVLNCRDLVDAAIGNDFAFRLALADPPYSSADAEKYGTVMIDRKAVMRALTAVVVSGGYLVWLDTCWPMHRKDQWRTVGRITIIRSTNHRVRLVSIFERVAAEAFVCGAKP